MKKLFVVSGVVCAFVLAVEAQNQKVPPPAAQSASPRSHESPSMSTA